MKEIEVDDVIQVLEGIGVIMFAGVDSCKAGWFAIQLSENNGWKVDVFPDVSSF